MYVYLIYVEGFLSICNIALVWCYWFHRLFVYSPRIVLTYSLSNTSYSPSPFLSGFNFQFCWTRWSAGHTLLVFFHVKSYVCLLLNMNSLHQDYGSTRMFASLYIFVFFICASWTCKFCLVLIYPRFLSALWQLKDWVARVSLLELSQRLSRARPADQGMTIKTP